MPERALVIRSQFPASATRGPPDVEVRISALAVALVNGTGTQDPVYPATTDTFKDWALASARTSSLWSSVVGYGSHVTTTCHHQDSISGTDRNMDGTVTPDE